MNCVRIKNVLERGCVVLDQPQRFAKTVRLKYPHDYIQSKMLRLVEDDTAALLSV